MRIYYEKTDDALRAGALHDAAYALLRRVLSEDFGVASADIRKTPEGKPYLADGRVRFSLSHTKGLVCCAVSADGEVGIDSERIRPVSLRAAERVCTERELRDIRASEDPESRFLVYWTLKESISKKRGVGLRENFRQYEILWDGEQPVCEGHKLQIQKTDGFLIAAAE